MDVAIRRPQVCEADASVADIRALFLDDHIHMALLVDGVTLISCVEREDIEAHIPGEASVSSIGRLAGRTVTARTSIREAITLMQMRSRRRLAVVDEHGSLLGLLCLKRSGSGFCSDADVVSCAAAHGSTSSAHATRPRDRDSEGVGDAVVDEPDRGLHR